MSNYSLHQIILLAKTHLYFLKHIKAFGRAYLDLIYDINSLQDSIKCP